MAVESENGRQEKTLQAGSGFLTQHTKELFFGLGVRRAGASPGPTSPRPGGAAVRVSVRWPSGLVQVFEDVLPNQRIEIEEGAPGFRATPFVLRKAAPAATIVRAPQKNPRESLETWLIEPLPAPEFSLPDFDNNAHTLKALAGRPVLLAFWDPGCPESCAQQIRLEESRAAFRSSSWGVLAISANDEPSASQARAFVREKRLTFPHLAADVDTLAVYNLIFRYLLDRHVDMTPPTTFLVDDEGRIIKVYQGLFAAEDFLKDWPLRPRTFDQRLLRARPFAGAYYGAALRRNYFTYGVAFFDRGYTDQALAAFQQAIAAKPDDADAYYNLGTLYLRKKMYPEARANLERAVKMKPEYPNAWNNLGMIAAEEGKPDEAIADFERAIEQGSADPRSRANLGYLYLRLGRPKDAEAELLKAVELSPNDPDAVYSLGMLYAGQNNWKQAATYLERAVRLRPDFPNALNNLGVLKIRQGDADGAEHEFQECIRVAPDYAQAFVNLSQLEAGLGRKDEARALLKEFLERHPDNHAVEEALRELH